MEHLFQTDGLGAELNLIDIVLFGPTAFVLHRKGLPDLARRLFLTMKFDDIGPANHS